MTTQSTTAASYAQWLHKLVPCHKNGCRSGNNGASNASTSATTVTPSAVTTTLPIDINMKRREAVHDVSETQPPPSFAGREYCKKMPYSAPHHFLANESTSGQSPPGSQTSCDDIIPPPKNCYRLVMLGSARVGKTCLVSRFLGGKFDDSYTPTIEDFHRKLYRIRGEVHQLDLLDTSGNHPFPAMRRLSFLTGDLYEHMHSRTVA